MIDIRTARITSKLIGNCHIRTHQSVGDRECERGGGRRGIVAEIEERLEERMEIETGQIQ